MHTPAEEHMKRFFSAFFVVLSSFFLSGCFYISMPFQSTDSIQEKADETPVVVGITHVILGDDAEKNDIFWEYTNLVVDNLGENTGYLGHRLRKRLFANDAWTMTVWETEENLDDFVSSETHRSAIQKGLPAVAEARFVRFTVEASRVPVAWDEVEQIMAEKGRDMY
jgi:heme-degrading monooxygenase HmoA